MNEILSFMIEYGFTFYNDRIYHKILSIKNKSKVAKRYLNCCYGSYKYNESKVDMYITASKLSKERLDIKLENNFIYLEFVEFKLGYRINIGYIFINSQITLERYPELLTCFLEVPKCLKEKRYMENKSKPKENISSNPCIPIYPEGYSEYNDRMCVGVDDKLYTGTIKEYNSITPIIDKSLTLQSKFIKEKYGMEQVYEDSDSQFFSAGPVDQMKNIINNNPEYYTSIHQFMFIVEVRSINSRRGVNYNITTGREIWVEKENI